MSPPIPPPQKKDDRLPPPPPPGLLRVLDFVLARHVLAAFILFFSISLAYLLLYTYRGDDSALDPVWQQLDHITFFHEGMWTEDHETLRSSWNCTYMAASGIDVDDSAPGSKRSRVCEFRNFCIDRDRGRSIADVFLVATSLFASHHLSLTIPCRGASDAAAGGYIILNGTKKVPPFVNIMAYDSQSDIYWSPRVFSRSPSSYYGFINETVFVYGMYSPYHLSHWLFNGLMPLWSMMRQYGATSNSWFFRPDSFDGIRKPSTFDMSFLSSTGRDIVLNPLYKSTPFQILAPRSSVPMCFARAVVGLSNRCPNSACTSPLPRADPATLHSAILNHYAADIHQFNNVEEQLSVVTTPTPTIVLLNRPSSRKIPNLSLLESRLRRAGLNVRNFTLDDASSLSLVRAAHLLHDALVLIAPHDDTLAAALFMPPLTTVISLNAYLSGGDPWFGWPMLQLGQRFYSWECSTRSCIARDERLARSCVVRYGVGAGEKAVERLVELEAPLWEYMEKEEDKKRARDAFRCYVEDVPRAVDVAEVAEMVERIVGEMGLVEGESGWVYDKRMDIRMKGFAKICREGKCCGPRCEDGLERFVFGEGAVWAEEEVTEN